jgi:hypothetical protein
MTHSTLHLAQSRAPPDLNDLDVRRRFESTVLGNPATVAVIGSSHYVGVPSIGFHELCSCRPIEGSNVTVVPLERGVEREVGFEGEGLVAVTRVEGRPLRAFPGTEDPSVAYRFGPDAYTTIDVDDGTIETYHTYPEFDLALFTRTTIETVPDERHRKRVVGGD